MISLQLTLLVLLLLLEQGSGNPEPQPVFRQVGSVVELGYCINMDYIVVYRVVEEGYQLLSNSSDVSSPVTPPPDLQGRIYTSHQPHLLDMEIKNLSHQDVGNYRWECWKNHALHNYQIKQLIVCDTEMQTEEIFVNLEEGGMEITCNSTAIGQDGVSVRWYHDVYPSYNTVLLLDSTISLEHVDGILQVKDHGATLVLNESMLINNLHFYCTVHKEEHCIAFQEMYMPDSVESKEIFVSDGEKVLLYCKADGDGQYWDTPLGKVDNVDERSGHMYISPGEQAEHFSLVIHAASEEHFGDYSCVSALYEEQYSLVKCPKITNPETFTFENEDVALHCNIVAEDYYMVQWYRRHTSGQQELIYDSGNAWEDSVPIPEDLRGRINLMNDDATLKILNVRRTDEGTYWCVVLKDPCYSKMA
ncbi:hypothetical protein WMY93_023648 [Mugilogobius chulae]|uniref:Ig-like domain-containing protein n=1 Tax=Mugilogobius chulae TaxID=88201 RepID=A0AAW0NER2_9GOBI